MYLSIICSLLLSVIAASNAAVPEDEITSLPGMDFNVNYKQYSGYLQGSTNRHLHYWFFESQSNPETDPLVLWLNGGPGCSSLMGLLTENGPIIINDDGKTVRENAYSWNKVANMLYLESPACVGFSYNSENLQYCSSGDISAADSNYLALQDFFNKYPEYKNSEFYITGESYGGIYVPTLVEKILRNQDSYYINIKGYAIGNGLSSYDSNDNSLIYFGNYHGLYGASLWKRIMDHCCDADGNCEFSNTAEMTLQCQINVDEALMLIYGGQLNVYGLYNYCPRPNIKTEYYKDIENLFRNFKKPEFSFDNTRSDPPCTDSSASRDWLNSAEVRAALHIPDNVQDWDICSDLVGFMYSRDYDTMKEQHLYNIQFVRGLMFNGDTDMSCNFLGQEWFIEDLQLEETEAHRMWYEGDQVAGFVKSFTNMTLLTVLGAGHMVPTDEPSRALQMFTTFLNNEPY